MQVWEIAMTAHSLLSETLWVMCVSVLWYFPFCIYTSRETIQWATLRADEGMKFQSEAVFGTSSRLGDLEQAEPKCCLVCVFAEFNLAMTLVLVA